MTNCIGRLHTKLMSANHQLWVQPSCLWCLPHSVSALERDIFVDGSTVSHHPFPSALSLLHGRDFLPLWSVNDGLQRVPVDTNGGKEKPLYPKKSAMWLCFSETDAVLFVARMRKANMKFSQNTSVEVKISCVRVLIKTCHTLHSLSGGFLFPWCRHLVQQHLVYILVAPHTHTHTAAHQTSFASSCLWSCSLNWANAG